MGDEPEKGGKSEPADDKYVPVSTPELIPNAIRESIERCCSNVYHFLGPALLELTYERALMIELQLSYLSAQEQFRIRGTYKRVQLDTGQDIDILANDSVVLELKAVETVTRAYMVQLMTYMKFAHKQYGLLINFDVPTINDLAFTWVYVDKSEFIY